MHPSLRRSTPAMHLAHSKGARQWNQIHSMGNRESIASDPPNQQHRSATDILPLGGYNDPTGALGQDTEIRL